MRLAISNIAWDIAEDDGVAALLHQHNMDAIDVAPGKYFPVPAEASSSAIADVRKRWADRQIEITGMQALLFGTSGLNVFSEPAVQEAMLSHLRAVCRIGAGLGARQLVFGSPKNRDRNGLSDAQAQAVAVAFFARLAVVASDHGVVFCLEPNPPCYGANFMTTSAETARVVEAVAHPAIRMQLDTGALTINGEDAAEVVRRHGPLIGHIHASEPDLLPIGDGATPHAAIAALLEQELPAHVVAIEMVATRNEPHLHSIARALKTAVACYGQRAQLAGGP